MYFSVSAFLPIWSYLGHSHRYTREIPEPAPFLSQHGVQIGGTQVFPVIRISGSSGAYITCIYCGLSRKMNTRKTPHDRWRSWTHLLCICFWVCGRQKPQLTMPWYTKSGISLAYLLYWSWITLLLVIR